MTKEARIIPKSVTLGSGGDVIHLHLIGKKSEQKISFSGTSFGRPAVLSDIPMTIFSSQVKPISELQPTKRLRGKGSHLERRRSEKETTDKKRQDACSVYTNECEQMAASPFVRLSSSNYPEDSVGRAVFPPLVEGRERPERFIDHTLSLPVSHFATEYVGTRAKENGLQTLNDLLQFPQGDLRKMVGERAYKTLSKDMERYLGKLTYLPQRDFISYLHGMLLKGYSNSLFYPTQEPVLRNVVDLSLPYLSKERPDETRRLAMQMGLYSWKPLTYREISFLENANMDRLEESQRKFNKFLALCLRRPPVTPFYLLSRQLDIFATLPPRE